MADFNSLLFPWAEFLTIMKGRRLSGVTQYEKVLRSFSTWLLEQKLSTDPCDTTREMIGDWLKDLFYEKGNLSNRSRASKLSAVRSFFSWLKYAGHRLDDPTKGIPSPKVLPILQQKFSTEELRLLFSVPRRDTPMGLRDLAMIKTLYAAGLRVAELINLNVSDIVDTGGYIRLQVMGKGGKGRTLTLRTNPSRTLRDWLLFRSGIESNTSAVFIRLKKGGVRGETDRLTTRSCQNILKKYARIVGIAECDVFCHKMRSTFATELHDAGYDIVEISILMGHKDINTTKGYIAISERTLRKTAIPDKRFNEIEEGERDSSRKLGGGQSAF